MRTAVIAIKILMNIKDQICERAVWVLDVGQRSSGTVGEEGTGRGPVVPGEEDHVGNCFGSALRGVSLEMRWGEGDLRWH